MLGPAGDVRSLREMLAGLRKESKSSHPIWETEGTPPQAYWFERLGSPRDRATMLVLRLISLIDAIWVPIVATFLVKSSWRLLAGAPMVHCAELTLLTAYAFGSLSRLRTSYVDLARGVEVLALERIWAAQALSIGLWADLFSLLGHLWWIQPGWEQLALVRLIRLWRLPSSSKRLQDLTIGATTDILTEFLECLASIWLMAHFFASGWFVAACWPYSDVSELLVDSPGYFFSEPLFQYGQCICYGAAMLVGWSGPTPTSPSGELTQAELVFCIVTPPIASIYMGFVFAQLLVLTDRCNQAHAKHMDHMERIGSVLASLGVPTALKQRVIQYHSFLTVHNIDRAAYKVVFDALSTSLHVELKLFLFENLVLTAPFFQEIPSGSVMCMVMAFEEQVYSPGDMIVSKGEVGDELFFVIKGICEVLVDDEASVCVALKEVGDYFGEIALVLDETRRTAWVRAKVFCVLAQLTRSVFRKTLEDAPRVMQMILQQIQLNTKVLPKQVNDDEFDGEVGCDSTNPLLHHEGVMETEDRLLRSVSIATEGALNGSTDGAPGTYAPTEVHFVLEDQFGSVRHSQASATGFGELKTQIDNVRNSQEDLRSELTAIKHLVARIDKAISCRQGVLLT